MPPSDHEVRVVTKPYPPASAVRITWAGPAHQARCSCGAVFDWHGLLSGAERDRTDHLTAVLRRLDEREAAGDGKPRC